MEILTAVQFTFGNFDGFGECGSVKSAVLMQEDLLPAGAVEQLRQLGRRRPRSSGAAAAAVVADKGGQLSTPLVDEREGVLLGDGGVEGGHDLAEAEAALRVERAPTPLGPRHADPRI